MILSRLLVISLIALALSTFSACSRYALTLNEQVVYMPPSLFKDYQLADANLHGCLTQTISDQQVFEAAQLRQLVCTSAGITNLSGLERFHQLEALNLANNSLNQAPELAKLAQLKILILRDNDLTEVGPLLGLLRLQQLDLSENPALPCADVQQLAANITGEIQLPDQCRD